MLRMLEILTWCLTGLQVVAVVTVIVLETVWGFHLSPAPGTVAGDDAQYIIANQQHWTAVAAPATIRGRRMPSFGPGVIAERSKKAKAARSRRGAGAARPRRSSSPAGGSGAGQPPAPDQIAEGGAAGPAWQVNEQGLPELPTIYLPYQIIDRYRHADEAKDALTSVASRDIPYGGGTAVQLGTIPPDHPLAKYIGLQQGDIVISVNGMPVSRQNGMDIYNRLKDEKSFRVEIERRGARFVAKYQRQ